jgi:hypothetical protein
MSTSYFNNPGMVTVPGEITPEVEMLLDRLQADFDPELVAVKPEAYSQPDACYDNVAEKVSRDGGKIHYGWAVWQSRHMVEAEHYAVWENENGDLLDVSPNKLEAASIMFISDDQPINNELMAIPNVRVNTSGSKLIDDFILLSETVDKLYGLSVYTDEEKLWLPESVLSTIDTLNQYRLGAEQLYMSGGKAEGPCYCGSKKTYKACHGRGIKLLSEDIVKRAKEVVRHELMNKQQA